MKHDHHQSDTAAVCTNKKRSAAHLGAFEANTGLLLFLFVAGAVFRRMSPWKTLVFWTVTPLALYPRWIHRYWHVWDGFLWTKIFSVLPLATLWCTFTRLEFFDAGFYRLGSLGVMALNIIEASLKDLQWSIQEHNWNHLNTVSGIMLILGEIPSQHTIETRNVDVAWSLGLPWITGESCLSFDFVVVMRTAEMRQSVRPDSSSLVHIVSPFSITAYTIWNWVFVYNNYPYSLGRHTSVLLSAFLLAWFDGWETWAQARCYTLGCYFLIRNTFYEQLCSVSDVAIGSARDIFSPKATDYGLLHNAGQVLSFAVILHLLRLNST